MLKSDLQQLGVGEDVQQVPGDNRISKSSCTYAKCREVVPLLHVKDRGLMSLSLVNTAARGHPCLVEGAGLIPRILINGSSFKW